MNPRYASLAASMLACSLPALAEDTTLPTINVSSGASAVQQDFANYETTTATKTDTLLKDIPQTVNVINQAVMASQGVTTLQDALANVAGITFSAGEGVAIGDSINLRGFSARTDVFMDGFRDRNQTRRDTFNLESVEVLKGASSMTFGRGSTGGVINQTSKKPLLKDENTVSVSAGTENFYRATADINQKLSNTSAIRLNVMGQSNDSTRDIVENEQWGVAPSLRLGIGTDLETIIDYLHQQNSSIPDYGFPLYNGAPIAADANQFYGHASDHYDQTLDSLGVKIQKNLGQNLTLRNRTQWSKSDIDANPSVPGTTNGTTITRSRRDRVFTDESVYNQTEIVAKSQTGAIKHTILAGLELGKETSDRTSYSNTGETVPSTSLSNPDAYAVITGSRVYNGGWNTDADSRALYVQDQLAFSEHWKLVAGLRYDYFSVDYVGLDKDNKKTPLSQTDDMLSQRLGLIFQPNDLDSFYLSYGTSFNPSAEALTLSVSTVSLDPEENRSLELGSKLLFADGNIGLNTAIYRTEKTNMRTTDPLNSSLNVLTGEAIVNGVEVEFNGKITADWQVLLSASVLDSETSKSNAVDSTTKTRAEGKELANTPKQAASLWTTYNLGHWQFGGGLNYVGERYTNQYNLHKVDAYSVLSATLAYSQPSWEARLNLSNLTDELYFKEVSGRAVPAQGRAAKVSVSYTF